MKRVGQNLLFIIIATVVVVGFMSVIIVGF